MLFYVAALPIMQDFRDNEKKRFKWPPVGHLRFYFCELCHGLSLCETLHFVLYSRSSYFALPLSYVNITKLLENSQ